MKQELHSLDWTSVGSHRRSSSKYWKLAVQLDFGLVFPLRHTDFSLSYVQACLILCSKIVLFWKTNRLHAAVVVPKQKCACVACSVR